MSRGYSSPPPPRRLKLQRQRLCKVARFSSDHETAPITQQRNRHVRVTPESGHLQCTRVADLGQQRTFRFHSITSSARCCMLNGTDRPSALAVFRLITISYFVAA